ncbi:unnamed protein product [Lactuca saligna]|uniref:Uncharacterized protein n=1 Tax=Lactuca saligna TaxID=75948 RepID=A0AA35Y726_LACSI|nr:unnamed protein product [Lactuca saligna]
MESYESRGLAIQSFTRLAGDIRRSNGEGRSSTLGPERLKKRSFNLLVRLRDLGGCFVGWYWQQEDEERWCLVCLFDKRMEKDDGGLKSISFDRFHMDNTSSGVVLDWNEGEGERKPDVVIW